MHMDIQFFLYILVIWLSISSASILVLLSGASAEACAFWRLLISCMLILLLSLAKKQDVFGIRLHHVVPGLMLALHFILWMRSLFLVEVYVSTLLVTLYPLYSLIIDMLVYKHQLSRVQVVGIVIATVLVGLYLNVHELVFNKGALYALFGGITCAVYFEFGSYARYKLKEDTLKYAFNTYLMASLFVGIYSAATGVNILFYPPSTYLYFLLLALVPMIMGHTLMNYLLGRYPASVVTSISYGEPFGAGLLAFLTLGQTITLSHVFFGVIIIAIVILVSITHSPREQTI